MAKEYHGGAYLRVFPEGMFIASKWAAPDGRAVIMKKEIAALLDTPRVTSAGCLCLSRKVVQDKRVNFYPLCKQAKTLDIAFKRVSVVTTYILMEPYS